MKEKVDFTEIKEMCDRLGVDCQVIENGVLITHKKDPWDGVEFARYKFPNHRQFSSFKVKSISEQMLTTEGGSELFKANCEPITESTYIEQLKKECFERFGEIKEGDRFEVGGGRYTVIKGNRIGYEYDKASDRLFYVISPSFETYLKDPSRVVIYQSGKWATRVKERVEVGFADYTWEHEIGRKEIVTVQFFCPPFKDVFETGKFLAKQLEEYLNR